MPGCSLRKGGCQGGSFETDVPLLAGAGNDRTQLDSGSPGPDGFFGVFFPVMTIRISTLLTHGPNPVQ